MNNPIITTGGCDPTANVPTVATAGCDPTANVPTIATSACDPTSNIPTVATEYLSAAVTGTASCPDGSTGESTEWEIPFGAYTSLISQEDADQQAQDAADALAEELLECEWSQLAVALPHTSAFGDSHFNTIAEASDSMVFAEGGQVELRLIGLAEARSCTGGVVDDGWYVGGEGLGTENGYQLVVSSPAQTYLLNSTEVQHDEVGGCEIWDFIKTITVDPGATITLSAASIDDIQSGHRQDEEGMAFNDKSVTEHEDTPIPYSQPYPGQFFVVQVLGIT